MTAPNINEVILKVKVNLAHRANAHTYTHTLKKQYSQVPSYGT